MSLLRKLFRRSPSPELQRFRRMMDELSASPTPLLGVSTFRAWFDSRCPGCGQNARNGLCRMIGAGSDGWRAWHVGCWTGP